MQSTPMTPDTLETGILPAALRTPQEMSVKALLLGERLDTRALESGGVLATAPLALALGGGAVAVLFRYGVAVLFGADREAADGLLARLAPFVAEPFPRPETEDARVVVNTASDPQIDAAGNIVLRDRSIERLQIVADVLAKSLVLGHYETRVAAAFDRIEPLAATLRDSGRPGARRKELLHLIGSVLGIQQRTVGRVETQEKPELLWEHPELERLYMRLAEEYELRDRDHALDRKLDVISRTVQTLLGLVQTRSSTRLEWYILLLIFAELLLAAYPLLLHSQL
ncbi:MAG TPA: RMD1 family protein [Stellaceae bacterium]|nr:RMD1 family protein [Stellaceae bacterium]